MGADFVFHIIPYPNLTPERKQEIDALISSLTYDDFMYLSDKEPETLEEERDYLRYTMEKDFETWGRRRDCGFTCIPVTGLSVRYVVSGGMSWDNSPTDIFDPMQHVADVPKLYDLLYKYAVEDTLPWIPRGTTDDSKTR
jgi:hypothetical protein